MIRRSLQAIHAVIIMVLVQLPLEAQPAAKFPAQLPQWSDVLRAANNASTTLVGSISASASQIPVADASRFVAPSIVTIGYVMADGRCQSTSPCEHVRICTVSVGQLTVCPGGRGASGTVAVAHSVGEPVRALIMAEHHESVATEVLAIAETLGVQARNVRTPESVTVANLPPASQNANRVYLVTDAASASTCTAGGGTTRVLCASNGSSWNPAGGMSGSGGGGGGEIPEDLVVSTLTAHDDEQSTIGQPQFTGSGNDDLSVSGEYTGDQTRTYCIRIDGTNPDTMRWGRDNCQSWVETGVPLPTSVTELENGLAIQFGSSSGHVVNDTWTILATAGGATYVTIKQGIANAISSAIFRIIGRNDESYLHATAGSGLSVWTSHQQYSGGGGRVTLHASAGRGAVSLFRADGAQTAEIGAVIDGSPLFSVRTTESIPLSLGSAGQERLRILADGDVEIRTRAVIGAGGPAMVQQGQDIEVRTNDGSSLARVRGGAVIGESQYVPYGGTSAPQNGCATWVNGRLVSTGASCASGAGGGAGQSKTFSTPLTTWTWSSSEHGLTTCDLVWEAYTLNGTEHTWTQGMTGYVCDGGNITVTWPVATAGKLVIGTGGGGSGGGLPIPGTTGLVVWDGSASTTRSIAGTPGKIVVSNASGVSGNPTISVGNDIADKTTANAFAPGAKQTFQPSSSTAGVNIACAGLPSNPSTGDIACDSADANRLKQFANGTWNALSGGSGGGGGSEFDPSQTYDLSGNNKVNMAYSSFYLQNDSTTGTALYRTVCVTSAGLAVQCSSGTYQRAIGICMEGCGTTGNARVGVMGKLTCDFDGSVTAGNWVTASSSQPGKCADAGTAKPAIPLGILLVTQTGQGSYDIVRGIQ